MSIEIYLETDHKRYDENKYKSYVLTDKKSIYGRIVLEKYGDIWNIELMNIFPKRKGYGTILLRYVLKEMKNSKFAVCPDTEESKRFFKKNGII